MSSIHVVFLAALVSSAHAALDTSRTFALLKEGEQLTESAAAELEDRVATRPNDLEDRLRLLSWYAGQQQSGQIESIRAARARHVLWLIRNEPEAAVFNVATRVYAIQPTGGALADDSGFQAAKEAWQRQLTDHPRDNQLKRNAATFLEIHEPAAAELLLKSTGDDRWLGQVYAKSVLGIVASDYRTSDPLLTSDEKRNSEFARKAMAELERTNNARLLGGAGFTLNRDGGFLYADGKLDWDYVPLASRLLERAGRIDPSNQDVFSVVPALPKRGERPPMTVRLGGSEIEKSLSKRVDPIRPSVLPANPRARVNVLVGLDGVVLRALAVDGPVVLRDAAVAAVKQWVFSPTLVNGKPVYVLSVVEFVFGPA